ncbi:hypothetical protein BJV82DRAFT_672284 [Fennellomyces sp. T-0311]|nr:hypothetical protein BJV82DRAFT_672284 [Fennellomyces sp. T-0311]
MKIAWLNNNFATAAGFIHFFGFIGSDVNGQVYFDPPLFFNGFLLASSPLAGKVLPF